MYRLYIAVYRLYSCAYAVQLCIIGCIVVYTVSCMVVYKPYSCV